MRTDQSLSNRRRTNSSSKVPRAKRACATSCQPPMSSKPEAVDQDHWFNADGMMANNHGQDHHGGPAPLDMR